MTLRFLCGLLSDTAIDVLSLAYRYLPPSTIDIQDMPMRDQFRYPDRFGDASPLPEFMGWFEFTQIFVEISEILFESNSNSINKSYSILRQFLPPRIYFYLVKTTSPNEWECFLRSLPLLRSIQLIQFDTKYFNLSQFSSLLTHLSSSSLDFLAVKLSGGSYSTIEQYSKAIRESELPHTKVSLELYLGDITDIESDSSSSDIFPTLQKYLFISHRIITSVYTAYIKSDYYYR